MQLLHRQIAMVHAAPLRPQAIGVYLGAAAYLPGLPLVPCNRSYLARESAAGARAGAVKTMPQLALKVGSQCSCHSMRSLGLYSRPFCSVRRLPAVLFVSPSFFSSPFPLCLLFLTSLHFTSQVPALLEQLKTAYRAFTNGQFAECHAALDAILTSVPLVQGDTTPPSLPAHPTTLCAPPLFNLLSHHIVSRHVPSRHLL